MAQFKNIGGKRYIIRLRQCGTRSYALQKAKEYRKQGLKARVVRGERGGFDVYVRS